VRRVWWPMLMCAYGCTPSGTDAVDTDAWLGRWNGPEGTYLDIGRAGGGYEITVRDLDGARTFSGESAADGIVFRRDGTNERLTATDGDATGMKWLAGKSNCLTIKFGEGYCRD
jgi:hypothetical protein